jgi:hypothetical protein
MKKYNDDFYIEAELDEFDKIIGPGQRLVIAMLWRIAKALEKK